MRKDGSKKIEEYEKKIEFLENRLKIKDTLLNNIIQGNPDKYKESTGYESLEEIEKVPEKTESSSETEGHTYAFLKIILESLPFPVFIKDEEARYLLVNKFEAKLFGLSELEIVGKQDKDFIKNEEELDIISKSDDDVLTRNRSVELPNQSFSLPSGRSYIFRTHKIPFINPITKKRNILGYSVDVTDSINLNNLRKFIINKLQQ